MSFLLFLNKDLSMLTKYFLYLKNDDAILEQTCLKTNLLIPLVKRKWWFGCQSSNWFSYNISFNCSSSPKKKVLTVVYLWTYNLYANVFFYKFKNYHYRMPSHFFIIKWYQHIIWLTTCFPKYHYFLPVVYKHVKALVLHSLNSSHDGRR